jgi:CheY-like chemotaxis protein
MPLQVLVVDDDEISREVLATLIQAEGYEVETVTSGDGALRRLREFEGRPDIVLTDMQMPGTRGRELAEALRDICGGATVLLAMSGSRSDEAAAFDGFLEKPFSMADLNRMIHGTRVQVKTETSGPNTVLDDTVFQKLAASMRPDRLATMYELCLTDINQRIEHIRQAMEESDTEELRRQAHALRGGCGMVGATELQKLAMSLEEKGFRSDDVASLDEIVKAAQRLRRMLVEHEIIHK